MKNKRSVYEFDDFRVDSGQFLLVKQGKPRKITPTVFKILLELLENAGEVVTKNDLMAKVWSDTSVEDGNLNRNISTLRRTLDETPSDHRYIETVPKSGYRFTAPIRKSEFHPDAGAGAVKAQPFRRSLVGREIEHCRLNAAFERAKSGSGGVVCLSGEIGSGKSVLIAEFTGDLMERGEMFHLATGRCSEPLTSPEPYGPYIECLGSLAKADGVAEVIREHAPTWHRELSTGEDGNSAIPVSGRMRREIVTLLRQLSSTRPVVLLIDDFHWADVASVELLSFLAGRLAAMKVLIVVCVRPTDLSLQGHPFLQARSQLAVVGLIQEIDLLPLTKEEICEYINVTYPQYSSLEDTAAFVLARSEGNPLFMNEILRSMSPDIAIAKHHDSVPQSLRVLIRSRFQPLQETDRRLLAAASVQGHEFDSAILAKSLALKPEDVEERLQTLCEVTDLIRRLREEELLDGKFTVRYSFTHVLYQVVCQESVPPTRKASLSSAVAEAFLTHYGN